MSRVRRFRPTCRDSADSTDHFAVHPPFSTSTSYVCKNAPLRIAIGQKTPCAPSAQQHNAPPPPTRVGTRPKASLARPRQHCGDHTCRSTITPLSSAVPRKPSLQYRTRTRNGTRGARTHPRPKPQLCKQSSVHSWQVQVDQTPASLDVRPRTAAAADTPTHPDRPTLTSTQYFTTHTWRAHEHAPVRVETG
jgi:hypothetical protein